MASRAYAQREWRLLSWWLATFHADADISMNVRFGASGSVAPSGYEFSSTQATDYRRMRYADALVIYPAFDIIVEAKMEPDPGLFSQLIHYARLFRSDPSYASEASKTLRLVALVYNDDASVAVEAPWYGIQWVVYQPQLSGFPAVAGSISGLTTIESPLPSDWPARLRSWGVQALTVP